MLPPDRSVTSSIRPSTWAGTPEIIVSGAGPNRDTGPFLRTNWWFAPMPPDVTRTAGARISKFPAASREDALPRSTSVSSSTVPRTPTTAPSSTIRSSTWCRNRNVTRPARSAASTGWAKIRTTSGPVPQARWNRGTELPCPSAVPPPRSAQPTTGVNRSPSVCTYWRFSVAANRTYAWAHCRGQWSSRVSVEPGGAEPIAQRQLIGVLDAHASLLRAVHEEETAERPESLPAEVVAVLLIQDEHPAAGFAGLIGGDQAGQPPADHDHVRALGHAQQPKARWPPVPVEPRPSPVLQFVPVRPLSG